MPLTIRIEPSNMQLNDPIIVAIVRDVSTLNASVPLARFHFQRSSPLVYEYEFLATDGRRWTQIITFAGADDLDPQMTFDAPQAWRLSEFSSHRGLRDRCVASHRIGLTLFRATWAP